jgi:uncharacterized damage-inducible protein DinB
MSLAQSFHFQSVADVAAHVAEHGPEVLKAVDFDGGFGIERDYHWYHEWILVEQEKAREARRVEQEKVAEARQRLVDEREERAVSAAERAARSAKWSAIWAGAAVAVAILALVVAAA